MISFSSSLVHSPCCASLASRWLIALIAIGVASPLPALAQRQADRTPGRKDKKEEGAEPVKHAAPTTPVIVGLPWTDREGRTIEAEFVKLDEAQGMITLQIKGREVSLPVTRLSDASATQAQVIAKAVAEGIPASWGDLSKDMTARFTFDGPEPEKGLVLKDVPIRDGILELNGIYRYAPPSEDGYEAMLKCPAWDYREFTVVARVRPDRLGDCVFAGGQGWRPFQFRVNVKGRLNLTLSGPGKWDLFQAFEGVQIHEGQAITLALVYSSEGRKASAYLDGRHLGDIELPEGFQLSPIGTSLEKADKLFSFTYYGGGTGPTLKGLADEVVLFGRPLSGDEVARVQIGRKDLGELK